MELDARQELLSVRLRDDFSRLKDQSIRSKASLISVLVVRLSLAILKPCLYVNLLFAFASTRTPQQNDSDSSITSPLLPKLLEAACL